MSKTALIPIVSVIILLCSCKTVLTVEEASRQEIMGGAAGSGITEEFTVKLSRSGNNPVEIQKVWVGDEKEGSLVECTVLEDSENQKILENQLVPKGVNSFLVRFSVLYPPEDDPRMQGEPAPVKGTPVIPAPDDLPPSYKKGAIIWFSSNKEGHCIVENFKRKQPEYLP